MIADRQRGSSELKEIAILFLKLGTTAFGGPAAHIAMMQDEVVRRRQWLTQEEFLDMLSATNFIPGPNSTEMAIHIGYKKGGMRGLVLAGVLFILPAALIVSFIAEVYLRFGKLPSVSNAFYGIKPVIVAVVFQALFVLGKAALKNRTLYAVFVLAIAASVFGLNELLVLVFSGLLTLLIRRPMKSGPLLLGVASIFALTPRKALAFVTLGIGASKYSLFSLFAFFMKVGSVLFGSGYVLLAFLRTDLVEKYKWLTDAQLLDATAVGQFTPGPVFTTATFIGYLLAGPMGATVATVGIFLPAFVFVAISAPYIYKLRSSSWIGAILDGVNVASLALMAVVTWNLGRSAIVDPITTVIAIISTLLLIKFRMNSAWLVLSGAIAGILLKCAQWF